MVKRNLEEKCKKAIIEITAELKDIKQKLHRIENLNKDIDKKTSHVLETLSVENIKKEYSALKNFYNDEIGYEKKDY